MTLFHIVVFPKAINTSTLLLMLSDPTKAHIVTIDVPWFLGDDVRTSPAKSFGEINTAADLMRSGRVLSQDLRIISSSELDWKPACESDTRINMRWILTDSTYVLILGCMFY